MSESESTSDTEKRYLRLFWKLQRHQWENYVCGASHDLSKDDQDLFEYLRSVKAGAGLSGHRRQVFESIVKRDLVDRHPDVARIRNRLDEKFASVYALPPAQSPFENKRHLARTIRADVLALMRTRSQLARDAGFCSYVDLVLSTEGLDLDWLTHLLERYVADNLPAVKALAAKHNVRVVSWYRDLDRMDGRCEQLNAVNLASRHLGLLGLSRIRRNIHVTCQECGLSGYAGVLSVPRDIRICVPPINSYYRLRTFFHELGHGMAHALNRETGIYKTWTAAYDEAMATLMEHVAVQSWPVLFENAPTHEHSTMEGIECAVSALFEFALWNNPDSPEDLYAKHFGQLGDVPYPDLWAADCFRSLDPVYKHNYVLGHEVAAITIVRLQDMYGDDFRHWGRWLAEHYYADGRKRTLLERLR